jgi:hypothetical protein
LQIPRIERMTLGVADDVQIGGADYPVRLVPGVAGRLRRLPQQQDSAGDRGGAGDRQSERPEQQDDRSGREDDARP